MVSEIKKKAQAGAGAGTEHSACIGREVSEMPEDTGRGMHGSKRRPPQVQAVITRPFSGGVVL